MYKKLLLIDFRGVIATKDSIHRHSIYARRLNSLYPNYRLMVISLGKETEEFESSGFIYRKENTFVRFIREIGRAMKSNEVALCICGDPWENFWLIRVLSRLHGLTVPIEIQMHGDFFNPIWRKRSVFTRLRYRALRSAVHRANQIRFVSASQMKNFLGLHQDLKSKTYVSPAYIEYSDRRYRKKQKATTLLHLGRLHHDRGVCEFIELCMLLHDVGIQVRGIIAGSGPLESRIRNQFGWALDEGLIELRGQLLRSELDDLWVDSGVLVSLAQTESFGRSMREALHQGVPVVSLQNSGAKDLAELVAPPFLNLIDEEMLEQPNLVNWEGLMDVIVPDEFAAVLELENEANLDSLVNAWLALTEPSPE